MKKECIITIIIVIAILIGEYITQNYTKDKLGEVENNLNNLKEEILSQNIDTSDLIKRAEEIYDEWEENNEYLAYFLEHDELEKVNTQIVLIKGYLESDSPQDSIPDLEEGLYIIDHIKEKETLKLRNVF